MDGFLAVILATALDAFKAQMGGIFNIVQVVLIPILAILYLAQRFVETHHTPNHKVLVLEVVGAVAVLEALAQGIKAFAGLA